MEPVVRRALDEDLGSGGDVTSRAVISPDATARAHVVAREEGVLAGVQPASLAFKLVDPTVKLRFEADEGVSIEAGEVVATVEGPTRSILTAERTALNFLGHLSGVATATGTLVAAVAGTGREDLLYPEDHPGAARPRKAGGPSGRWRESPIRTRRRHPHQGQPRCPVRGGGGRDRCGAQAEWTSYRH